MNTITTQQKIQNRNKKGINMLYELFFRWNETPPLIPIEWGKEEFFNKLKERLDGVKHYQFPDGSVVCMLFETEEEMEEMAAWLEPYVGYPDDAESIPGWNESEKWIGCMVKVGDPSKLVLSEQEEEAA